MKFRKVKKKVLRKLGKVLTGPLVNILCKTLRIKEQNKESLNTLLRNNDKVVFTFWHGTMLLPWFILRKYSPSAIVSSSKDGDLLQNVLRQWKYKVKRGSSSKGGKEVLEELIEEAKNGNHIAITPDGPRGPEKIMKAGAAVIAKKSTRPIVLIGVGHKNKIILKSWDNFEIPYFFSKVVVKYSQPIYIDSNLTYEETDIKITMLNKKINELQNQSEQECLSL